MEWIETEATLQSTAQKGGRGKKGRGEKKGGREKTGCDEFNRSRTVWVAAHWSYGHTFQCSSSSNATWWERFNANPKHLERDFKRMFCPRQKKKTTASLVCSNQTVHQTRSGELDNSENPLITRSDNAFSLKKTIIVNIFEFTTIGSNMTWQMVCHTQPSQNEPWEVFKKRTCT